MQRLLSPKRHPLPLRNICLIAGIMLPVLFAVPVLADSGTRGIQTIIKNMLNDICELGANDGVLEILAANPAQYYPAVWGIVETLVRNVIMPVSYSLLGLYFIVALVSAGMKYEGLTMEMLAKPFVRFVAAFIAVRCTPNLLITGMAAGSQFVSAIQSNTSSLTQAQANTIAATAYGYAKQSITGYFSGFTIMMQLFLPWIAAKILGLLLKLIAYSLVVEIFATAVLMPLTFGEVITHGIDGGGFLYLKRYFALCLQAGIMIIVAQISIQFALSWWEVPSFEGFLKGAARMLVAEGACAFLMIKSGEICRSALGV